MNYTKEELEVIKIAFEKCQLDFLDAPLSIEKDEDVLTALNMYHDKYYMNTPNYEIAKQVYAKMGMWIDGKTTLEDHDRQELQRKLDQTIRYKNARQKQLSRLKDLKKAIETSIQKVEEEPLKIAEQMHTRRKEIQSRAYDAINDKSKQLQDHLKETARQLTEEYENEKTLIINNLNDDLALLKVDEKREIDKVLEEYDELEKLKREYEQVEQEAKNEIDRLEVKMEEADASLFDLTVRELKEIADNKGIEYPSRIVKADLVDLIENKDDEMIFED